MTNPSPRRGARSEALYGVIFVLPAVLAFAAIALYPIAWAAWLSLHRRLLVFHENQFIGLANYAFLLRDARFYSALGNTLVFAIASVTMETLLGLGAAVLLDRAGSMSPYLRAAILVPWAVPTVVSAKIWAWIDNPDYGLVARLLPGRDIDVMGAPGLAMGAAVVADVWKTTPFVTLLLLAALQTVPRDLYRAARVDGASPFVIFYRVTLPSILPAIGVTLVFRTLDAIRVFDVIYVLTGGGPANTTETLSIYAYKTLMRLGDFGYGSTLSTATFLCTGLLSLVYLRAFGMKGAVAGKGGTG